MLYNTILEQFEDDLFNEETQYTVEPLDEAVVFISDQGKKLKKEIKNIFAENTQKISDQAKGVFDVLFKSKAAINEQVVNKIVAGIEKLGWDSFSKSKLFRINTAQWEMGFTGRKGDYLYNFYVIFGYSGNAALSLLGFSEKNLSKYTVPKKAIDATIKNIKNGQWCRIKKKYIQVFDLIDDLDPANGYKVNFDFYDKLNKMFPNNSKINKEAQRIEFFGKID